MKNTLRLVGLASLCGLSLSSCVVYDPIGGPVAGGYPVAPGTTYYSPAPAVSSVAYYDDDYYYNPGYTTYARPFYSPVSTSFSFFGGSRYHDHCDTPRHYGYSRGSSGIGPSSRGMSGSAIGSRSSGSSMMRPTASRGSGFSGSSGAFSGSSSSRPVMRSSGNSGSMRSVRPGPAPRSSAPRASGGSSGRGGSMGSFQASGSRSGSSSQKMASLSSYKKK